MDKSILISKNVRLTFRLTAKRIYVSNVGDVTFVIKQFGPDVQIPEITVEYLEALCSKFYYGGYTHRNAIADIMLLNGFLRAASYDDFYYALHNNLKEQRITVISSELFQ